MRPRRRVGACARIEALLHRDFHGPARRGGTPRRCPRWWRPLSARVAAPRKSPLASLDPPLSCPWCGVLDYGLRTLVPLPTEPTAKPIRFRGGLVVVV